MAAPNAIWPELQPLATRLRREGLTNAQIAERLSISMESVWRWIGPTPRHMGGQPVHDYGLRYRARYLKEAGYTVREIAEEMKIPRSTVGDWVKEMPCDT